jgi:hypothetical protein
VNRAEWNLRANQEIGARPDETWLGRGGSDYHVPTANMTANVPDNWGREWTITESASMRSNFSGR